MASVVFRTPARRLLLAALLLITLVHFADGCWRARSRGIVDFPIFLNEAAAYLDSGVLYPYLDTPELYGPAAAVYKFPPLFATLLLPVARADHGQVATGHWLLQIAVYLGTCVWLLVLLGARRRPAFALVVLLLWLNAEPFFETLWRQQLETYLLLLFVAALAAIQRDDDGAAGAALGAAATLKVYPAMLLGAALAGRRWRGLLGAAAAGVLLTTGTVIVIGVDDHLRWLGGVLPLLLRELPFDDVENVSIAAAAIRLTAIDPRGAGLLSKLLTVPALLWSLWLAARHGGPAAPLATRRLLLGLFVAMSLVWMPNAWGNYQLLLLLPILLVLDTCAADGRRRRGPEFLVAVAAFTLLFAIPCPREMIGQWPCAETPPWLGLAALPRGLHDSLAATRVIAAPLVWLAVAWSVNRAGDPGGSPSTLEASSAR